MPLYRQCYRADQYHFERALKLSCIRQYDPSAQYPRIFNGAFLPVSCTSNQTISYLPLPDLFTFKSPSHLLKLSLSHAIAQSTKLSVYESAVQDTLADTSYIPKELALTGELELDRREAVKLTGRLFRLRVEVNLVSNVLGEPRSSSPSQPSLGG